MTMRPLARSSTNKKRPSRSTTAATVTSGFHTMVQIIPGVARGCCGSTYAAAGGLHMPSGARTLSEVNGRGAHFRLDQAAGPDFIEVGEVPFDHRDVVEIDHPFPARALLPEDD